MDKSNLVSGVCMVLLVTCFVLYNAWRGCANKLHWAECRRPPTLKENQVVIDLEKTQMVIDLDEWHLHVDQKGQVVMMIKIDSNEDDKTAGA